MTGAAIADKLDEARKLIEAGWCRAGFYKRRAGRTCYCAWGAIAAVHGGITRPIAREAETFDAVIHALGAAIGHRSIWQWNDDQPSKKPIIEAFRKAADLARAEQSA